MIKFLFLAATIFFFQPPIAYANDDVVVIQSSKLKPYHQAAQGFLNSFQKTIPLRGPKSISPGTVTFFYMSDYNNISTLTKRVKRLQPDFLLAIGSPALMWARETEKEKPVIFCMVPPSDCSLAEGQKNITAVKFTLPLLSDRPENFPIDQKNYEMGEKAGAMVKNL